MPFTMENVNYAVQYSQALANVYPYLSYFDEVWNSPNSGTYRPVNGKTVMIPSLTVSGARAVDRDQITGNFSRNFNNQYQPVTCQMDREWDTLVDPMDIVQTDGVATIANITKTFNEQQKIPEMDSYAASTMAGFAANFGGVDSTVLSSTNILEQWDSYLVYMTSQRINRDRVVAYMTPATYKLLKEAAGITRFLDAGTGIRNVDRNVGKLDGVVIKEVPPDLMKTAYDYTEGWVPQAGASQINMLLMDPMAVVAPIVYETSMMSAPTAQSKGKYLYYERYYYDVFGLNNRLAGFFANMGAPQLGALTVTSAAGTGSGNSVITVAGANVGTYGTSLVYASQASSGIELTYGQAPSGGTFATLPATNVNGVWTANVSGLTAGQYITVALVNNQTGNVIASGNCVIVTGD